MNDRGDPEHMSELIATAERLRAPAATRLAPHEARALRLKLELGETWCMTALDRINLDDALWKLHLIETGI